MFLLLEFFLNVPMDQHDSNFIKWINCNSKTVFSIFLIDRNFIRWLSRRARGHCARGRRCESWIDNLAHCYRTKHGKFLICIFTWFMISSGYMFFLCRKLRYAACTIYVSVIGSDMFFGIVASWLCSGRIWSKGLRPRRTGSSRPTRRCATKSPNVSEQSTN